MLYYHIPTHGQSSRGTPSSKFQCFKWTATIMTHWMLPCHIWLPMSSDSLRCIRYQPVSFLYLLHYWPVSTLLTCAYTTDLCLRYWPVSTLLTCAYTTDLCLHYWPVPTLLTCAYTTDLCLHYWSMAKNSPMPAVVICACTTDLRLYYWPVPTLLTCAYTTDLCLHYWPVPTLLTCTYTTDLCLFSSWTIRPWRDLRSTSSSSFRFLLTLVRWLMRPS